MTMQSWIDSEPGARATFVQAGSLLRRGFQRPVVTIGTTLVLVFALVGKLAHESAARRILTEGQSSDCNNDHQNGNKRRHAVKGYRRSARKRIAGDVIRDSAPEDFACAVEHALRSIERLGERPLPTLVAFGLGASGKNHLERLPTFQVPGPNVAIAVR